MGAATASAQSLFIIQAIDRDGVTEGGAESFGVVGSINVPTGPVTATCTVTAGSSNPASPADFRAADGSPATNFPVVTLTFTAANYRTRQNCDIHTFDDLLAESAENFIVTLSVSGGGAVLDTDTSFQQSNGVILDNGARSLGLTGAATHAETDADTTITYTVDLSGAASTAVRRLTWSIDHGTTEDADFAAVSGDLTYPTATTFDVTVVGDDVNEGDETFTVTVRAATGNGGAPSVTTTITDDDDGTPPVAPDPDPVTPPVTPPDPVTPPAPPTDNPAARATRVDAPTAAVAKGVGQLASQAVVGRLRFNAGAGGNTLTVAGRNLIGGEMETFAAEYLSSGRDLSAAELLRQSGFSFTGNNGGRGFNFWGGGSYVSADGEDGGVSYDGDTTAFHVGVDTHWRDGLIGIAVGTSDGDTDFTDDNITSKLETDVTSVHPYLTRKFTNVQLWTTVGYGTGDAELTEDDAVIKTDVTVTTAALGLTVAPTDGVTLIADGTYTRAQLDAASNAGRSLPKATADNLRLNAAAELSGQHDAWRSFLTVNVRHDSGDGDTGAAGDLGGGLEWHSSTATLRLEGSKYLTGSGAEEERINFTARKTTGRLNLGLTVGMDNGVNTANLLTGEWQF